MTLQQYRCATPSVVAEAPGRQSEVLPVSVNALATHSFFDRAGRYSDESLSLDSFRIPDSLNEPPQIIEITPEIEHRYRSALTTINANLACAHVCIVAAHAAIITTVIPYIGSQSLMLLAVPLLSLLEVVVNDGLRLSNEATGAPWLNNTESFRAASRIEQIVSELCEGRRKRKPKVILEITESRNAGLAPATFGNDLLFLTSGLERSLTDRQLRAVVSHELCHADRLLSCFNLIRYYHRVSIPTLSIGALLASKAAVAPWVGGWIGGGIGVVAYMGACLAAVGVVVAFGRFVSRQNEFSTDIRSVALARDPDALAAALRTSGPEYERSMDGWRGFLESIFRTHPEIGDRISFVRRVFGSSPASSQVGKD